jgi:hypothetical protein
MNKVDLENFLDNFSKLSDSRSSRNRLHCMDEMLLLMLYVDDHWILSFMSIPFELFDAYLSLCKLWCFHFLGSILGNVVSLDSRFLLAQIVCRSVPDDFCCSDDCYFI